MIKFLFTVLTAGACAGACYAQASGNVGYSQSNGSARAKLEQQSKRALAETDIPPTATSMFLEASVPMNVKADEYVAVFGLAQEGANIADCNQKMDPNR
jgi:hypothetical protein